MQSFTEQDVNILLDKARSQGYSIDKIKELSKDLLELKELSDFKDREIKRIQILSQITEMFNKSENTESFIILVTNFIIDNLSSKV